MIDFFADARAFIDGTGDNTTIDYTETTPKDFKQQAKPEEIGEQKELCFYDGLEIAEDGSIISIDRESFKVPEWYNKASILERDKKTIDMVFIHYGYDHSKLNDLYKRSS